MLTSCTIHKKHVKCTCQHFVNAVNVAIYRLDIAESWALIQLADHEAPIKVLSANGLIFKGLTYLENLFNILPAGVVSKKLIGE